MDQPQGNVDLGLSVFLKHSAASDQRVFCTLAQICKAWRTAVQQFTVVTAVSVKGWCGGCFNREAIASFASWLRTHCHLVHSIEISDTRDACVSDPALGCGMLACHNDVAVLQAGFQQVQLSSDNRWKLQKYSSPSVVSTSLLRTLPASTLTMLEIPGNVGQLKGLAAALANLTQLRCLTLGNARDVAQHDTVHAVAAMTNLTKFSIGGLQLDCDLERSLPASLSDVSIVFHHPWSLSTSLSHVSNLHHHACVTAIQLQRLTAVEELSICNGFLYENHDVALPLQIQQLKLDNCGDPYYRCSSIDVFGISSLRHLQTLDMTVNDLDSLVSLTTLSELKHLKLYCGGHPTGVRFLHALPKLVGLQLEVWDTTMSQFAEWTNSITACTGLTELRVDVLGYLYRRDDDSDNEIGADAQGEGAALNLWHLLASLPNLSSLVLGSDDLDHVTGREDVYGYPAGQAARSGLGRLSELSRLTFLELEKPWPKVLDAADMQCLAWSLTCLHVLHVGPNTWGVVPLPAIGHLRCLQSFWYGKDGSLYSLSPEQAQQGLGHLTDLSMLTDLRGFKAAGPHIVEDFWAAVKCK